MSVWTNIENAASVEIKTIWNYDTKRWRVFYGLNGAEPVNEFKRSQIDGIYFGESTSESIGAYVLMSNGSVDLDHFEIVPRYP